MAGEPLQLLVTIGLEDDASAEARDDAARLLRRELEDAEVGAIATPTLGDAPPGAKAPEALLFGALLVGLLPGTLALFLAISRDWAARRPGRTLTFSYSAAGQQVELQYDPGQTDPNQLLSRLLEAQAATLAAQAAAAPAATAALSLGAGSQVGGDVVGGDKVTHSTIGGDSVGRDKITYVNAAPGATVIVGAAAPPALPPDPAAA